MLFTFSYFHRDGNLKLHKGDALNRETFQGCIAETDVVMSCLGSHDLRFSTVSLYSQSIKEIHEVMKRYVSRFIEPLNV